MVPTRKVSVGIAAGSACTLAAWALNKWTAADLGVTEVGAFQVFLTFALQWVIPEKYQKEEEK